MVVLAAALACCCSAAFLAALEEAAKPAAATLGIGTSLQYRILLLLSSRPLYYIIGTLQVRCQPFGDVPRLLTDGRKGEHSRDGVRQPSNGVGKVSGGRAHQVAENAV